MADTVTVLLQRLFHHSRLTYNHSIHVATIAYQLAGELGLSKDEVQQVFLGAVVHNIGKIRIPKSTLHKKGKLTPAEWQKMYRHPEEGCKLLPDSEAWKPIKEMILYHHEKWNGGGYYGLKGKAIPLGARIIALADAFEAMTSPRPYQKMRDVVAAMQEVERCSGTQFDPEVVDALFSLTKHLLKGRPGIGRRKINEILIRTTLSLNSNEL